MAVDHIDAVIKDGSVFGLIGTNGAGKSTTIRILLGLISPTKGNVEILAGILKRTRGKTFRKLVICHLRLLFTII